MTSLSAHQPLRCAVIGLGRIASLLEDDPHREKPATHCGAIAANPDCVLAGGWDTDPERRTAWQSRWQAPVNFSSAADLLEVCKPDILVIATHPDSHRQYLELGLRHLVPVIICEKPLAHRLSDAVAMAKAATRSTSRVLVNHERRYSADYREAKNILREGRLGPVLGVCARLCMGASRRLDRVLWHDGTHIVDILRFLLEAELEKTRIIGELGSSQGSAWIHFNARSRESRSSAVPVSLELGAGRDHLLLEIELSCARGRLRVGNGIWEEWISEDSPYYSGFRSLRRLREGRDGKSGYFSEMMADAVRCARDPQARPVSDISDGLAAVRLLRRLAGRDFPLG